MREKLFKTIVCLHLTCLSFFCYGQLNNQEINIEEHISQLNKTGNILHHWLWSTNINTAVVQSVSEVKKSKGKKHYQIINFLLEDTLEERYYLQCYYFHDGKRRVQCYDKDLTEDTPGLGLAMMKSYVSKNSVNIDIYEGYIEFELFPMKVGP